MDDTPRQQAIALKLDGRSYAEIATVLGISRQRVQQIIAPPTAIRKYVQERAAGLCEKCGIIVGKQGHVHHIGSDGLETDMWNDIENLQLLCMSCHRKSHSDYRPPSAPRFPASWDGEEPGPEISECPTCGQAVARCAGLPGKPCGKQIDIRAKHCKTCANTIRHRTYRTRKRSKEMTTCPTCSHHLPESDHRLASHLDENNAYYFDCDNCGADLVASQDDEDRVTVRLDDGYRRPLTGSELHNRKGW